MLLQFLISVTLLTLIISKYNISLLREFRKLPKPFWLIFPLLITTIFIPFSAAFRWQIFLKPTGVSENIFSLMKINFISIFWGIFLPSADGFAAIKIYLIEKKHPQQSGKTGSSVILEKIFGFLLLCFWGIGGSFAVRKINGIGFFEILLFVVAAVLILILVFITNKRIYIFLIPVLGKLKFARKPVSYLMKLYLFLTDFPYWKILARALPVMILLQFLTILNVFFLFKAMNIHLPFVYHLAFVPIIIIISLIPVSISGFGVRESAFVYFYHLLGIPAAISFKVSILNFLILTGVPALIGGIIGIFGQIKKNDIFINSHSRL